MMMQPTICYMELLPTELKLKIITCLWGADVVNLASVTHEWRRLASQVHGMTLLPADKKLKIIDYLQVEDVLKLPCLNREWRRFMQVRVADNWWWEKMCFADDSWKQVWEDFPSFQEYCANWKQNYIEWILYERDMALYWLFLNNRYYGYMDWK